eukprot:scaffold370_cov289-Prasinococcus_capsulatus_cf.AAC.1
MASTLALKASTLLAGRTGVQLRSSARICGRTAALRAPAVRLGCAASRTVSTTVAAANPIGMR